MTYQTKCGAYVNPADYGTSVTMAQGLSDFDGYTSRTITAHRTYYGTSTFPSAITSDLQADQAAGRRALLSFKPAYNPTSSSDLTSLENFLDSCVNAGLDAVVALWHEPYSQGLTAAQYKSMISYYGPAVRQRYPLCYCQASYPIASGKIAAGDFYPGDSAVDQVAIDVYCDSYLLMNSILTTCAAVADGASPPKPFGIWEYNSNNVNQTQTEVTSFLTGDVTNSIKAVLAARTAAGKDNADISWFQNTAQSNATAIMSSSDYRVPAYQQVFDTAAASSSGSSGPGLVQKLGSASGVASTLSITVGADTTAGNMVSIAGRGASGDVITAVTDTRGNTWSVDAATSSGKAEASLASAIVAAGKRILSGDTITVTFSGANDNQACAAEYRGVAVAGGAAVVDQSATAHSATASVTVATTSNSAASGLVISAAGGSVNNGTLTVTTADPDSGGSWSDLACTGADAAWQAGKSSASLYSAAWSAASATNTSAVLVTYKATTAAAALSGTGSLSATASVGGGIAEDASTPAPSHSANGTSVSATSASFSPPAASLVVVTATWLWAAAPSVTTLSLADSNGNTYTAGPAQYSQNAYSATAIFTRYYASAPGAITVTCTRSGDTSSADCQLAPRVLTGAAASQAGAATTAAAGSGTSMEVSLTTTTAGSWVYVCGGYGAQPTLTAAPTTTTIQAWPDSNADTGAIGRSAAATTTPGAASYGWSASASVYTHYWAIAAAEILPAPGGVTASAGLSGTGTLTATASGAPSPVTGSDSAHAAESPQLAVIGVDDAAGYP